MKRAVVLSGGGAKGAYELGVWKALRKLGINYDIVTGTSIGALNGIMMAQNEYNKCLKTWYYMNYDYVSNMEIKGKYSTNNGRKEILRKYAKGMISGGYEMDGLSKVIDNMVDYERFSKSNIDFGLVTTYFPSFKVKYVTKSMLTKENIKSYLIASASCFPAFKPTKIGKDLYVDGGYTDNLPINLAIKLGADEIIAVNMRAVGILKKTDNNNIPITYITPNNKLGSLLVFEKDYTRSYMKLGYNDTMKVYKKLEGNKYTFKLGSLKRNYDRIGYKFYDLYDKYNSYITIRRKISDNKKEEKLNDVFENLLEIFEVDYTPIYRTSYLNVLLRKKVSKYDLTHTKLRLSKFSKNNISKDLICYIYKELKYGKKRSIERLNIMFPKAFMCALYLKIIER